MGGLNIIVTGSAGFLGQATCKAARADQHKVTGLTRKTADLSQPLPSALFEGADVIIHTAAAMSNDAETLEKDTVTATQNLIDALLRLETVPRVVLASSVSLYDADAPSPVTEASPLETQPHAREPYMRAKRAQEEALRRAKITTSALRIGLLYDETTLPESHLGIRKGPVLVSLAQRGAVPLVHVEDAARALVLAAENPPEEAFSAVNIVETPQTDRHELMKRSSAKLRIPLHWRLLLPLAYGFKALLAARAPGLLQPRILKARMSAAQYDTGKAKSALGWTAQPRFVSEGTP